MYKIKDWENHFETAKTKTFNRCQRLTFSNDLNDPHFRRLVRGHKDGYAHFGIWVAICEFHSSQSKPRLGYLTDDGQPSGTPLGISEIADLIRAPEKMVKTALERLSDPYIGWITDERRPCDDHKETAVGVQSSPLISPLHSTPLHSTIPQTTTKVETGDSIYLAVAKRYHEHQRVNFPKDSALLRDPDKLDADGAVELERFERINGWAYDKIVEVLKRVLDDPEYRKNIISLRTVRKNMSNGSMKLENADKYAKAPKPGFGNFFDGIENVLEEAYPDAD